MTKYRSLAGQLPTGTTNPTNPVVGEEYYHTGNNAIMRYDGSMWRGLKLTDPTSTSTSTTTTSTSTTTTSTSTTSTSTSTTSTSTSTTSTSTSTTSTSSSTSTSTTTTV